MSADAPARPTPDLWSFAWGMPQVDPNALSRAIAEELQHEGQDFRTKLLIRDGADALERYWGAPRWQEWVARHRLSDRIEAIRHEDLGPPGFHFTPERLMPATDPEDVRRYLRELGNEIARPVAVRVGGSIPLILRGLLARATGDIDVVDEVPEPIRSERRVLSELKASYGLVLAHFASHYLPDGWQTRTTSLGSFGKLQVELVDAADIFVSKLFSARRKDLDDLRVLTSRIDLEVVRRRLPSAKSLLGDPTLRAHAEKNWYVLFGESLPTEPAE